MNRVRFAFAHFVRDWKSGEQAVIAMAVIIAVAALTAIAFFTNRIALGVEQQAGEVLAADLRVESAQPFNDDYLTLASERQLKTARVVTFASVVLNGESSSLVALRAVSPGYPLRGQVKVSRSFDAVVEEVVAIPARGEVWADPRLLTQLSAAVGDQLEIGRSKLTISRVLIARPDQGTQFVDMAPSAVFNLDDLQATELIQPGSRASYALLFAGAPATVATFKKQLLATKRPGERVVDIEEASPQIRASIDRAGRFLNLASLISVLLSAIAVAMASRRYAARRMDVVALMKSMGATQNRVLLLHLLQLLMLAILASLIGTAIGYAAQQGLAWLLKDLIRGALPGPSLTPAILGIATAICVLIGFALPPLLQLVRVPPIRVLRRDVEPPPLHFLIINGFAVAAVVALVTWVARDIDLVLQVMIGMTATFFSLYAAGWLLVKILTRFRGGVGVAWRYGIANIARRGHESIVQVVAFGLGIMVLLLLILVRNDILNSWRASLPANAPNQFLINIQPHQIKPITDFFTAHGLAAPTLVPMVRARLAKINDMPLVKWRAMRPSPDGASSNVDDGQQSTDDQPAGESERQSSNNRQTERNPTRGATEREANLTWSEKIPTDNKIVSGRWWNKNTANDKLAAYISVEKNTAARLRLKLGDRLTYDVAGEPITATVTSIREVEWDTFKPNFFVVFSPGVIDHAVSTYITSIYVPTSQHAMMRDFTRKFPEVTAIDIDAVVAQIRSVMDKVSLAIEYVSLFTLLAGVAVLFAAIQSTRDERRYESAMLRTLGASRRVVLQGIAAEFIVLGTLAGLLAAAGASFAGYLLTTRFFDLEYTFQPTVWYAGVIGGMALVGLIGILVTYSVINAPPVETLRRGGD